MTSCPDAWSQRDLKTSHIWPAGSHERRSYISQHLRIVNITESCILQWVCTKSDFLQYQQLAPRRTWPTSFFESRPTRKYTFGKVFKAMLCKQPFRDLVCDEDLEIDFGRRKRKAIIAKNQSDANQEDFISNAPAPPPPSSEPRTGDSNLST